MLHKCTEMSTKRNLKIRLLYRSFPQFTALSRVGGYIWYQRFKAEMLAIGFVNNQIAPCLFIKQINQEFISIAIYVDDISTFATPAITAATISHIKDHISNEGYRRTYRLPWHTNRNII